jgi:four helix bundle protein
METPMALVEEVYRLSSEKPSGGRFGFTAQMRRAAVSIPSHMAEGYGRSARGDYLQQLAVANGSLKELETQLLIANRLGYLCPGGKPGSASNQSADCFTA